MACGAPLAPCTPLLEAGVPANPPPTPLVQQYSHIVTSLLDMFEHQASVQASKYKQQLLTGRPLLFGLHPGTRTHRPCLITPPLPHPLPLQYGDMEVRPAGLGLVVPHSPQQRSRATGHMQASVGAGPWRAAWALHAMFVCSSMFERCALRAVALTQKLSLQMKPFWSSKSPKIATALAVAYTFIQVRCLMPSACCVQVKFSS